MDLFLHQVDRPRSGKSLHITGSKSESNRLLILKQLFPDLQIENLSNSDDTVYLNRVLNSGEEILDIGHAGTAMRFGTAYFASQPGVVKTMTGSQRMKQRPIGVLVAALQELGASVSYLGAVGYPPLRVEGTSIKGGTVVVDGSVSSQFITALLLIAPSFTQGLQLRISKATSIPYIKMTYRMLQELGVSCSWEQVPAGDLHIHVEATKQLTSQIAYVESDWSSAGYWYSWVAMQDAGYSITLDHYREDSLQGDRRLQEIYASLGVDTSFKQGSMQLLKTDLKMPAQLDLDLRDVPDQAQTIFATCIGLGINAHLTGLQTLKIKETDRIEAMQVVGSRFRESEITTTDHSITLKMDPNSPFSERVEVDTYHDHRMALAFAPLCVKTSVIIKDAGVVSKSYGAYWDDLKALNVGISER